MWWPVLLLPALANLRSEEAELSAEERLNVAAVVNTGKAMGAEAARALAADLRTAPPEMADKLRKLAASVAWEGTRLDKVLHDLKVKQRAEHFLRAVTLSGLPLFGRTPNLLPAALNPGTLGFDKRTHNMPSSLLEYDGSDFNVQMPQTPVLDFTSGSVYDDPAFQTQPTFDSVAIAEERGDKPPTFDDINKKNAQMETLFQQNLASQQRNGYKSEFGGLAVSPTLDDEVMMTGPLADMQMVKDAIKKPLDDLHMDDPLDDEASMDIKAAERAADAKAQAAEATPNEAAAMSTSSSKTDLDGWPTIDTGARAVEAGASLLQQHLKTSKVIATAVAAAGKKAAAPSSLLEANPLEDILGGDEHTARHKAEHAAKVKKIDRAAKHKDHHKRVANLASMAKIEARMQQLMKQAKETVQYPTFDDLRPQDALKKDEGSSFAETQRAPASDAQKRQFVANALKDMEKENEAMLRESSTGAEGERGLLDADLDEDLQQQKKASLLQTREAPPAPLKGFDATLATVETKLQAIRDRIATQQASAKPLPTSLLQAVAKPAKPIVSQADVKKELEDMEAQQQQDMDSEAKAYASLQKTLGVDFAKDSQPDLKEPRKATAHAAHHAKHAKHAKHAPSSLLQRDPDDTPLTDDADPYKPTKFRAAGMPTRIIPVPVSPDGGAVPDDMPMPSVPDPSIAADVNTVVDAEDPQLDKGDGSAQELKSKLEVASNAQEGLTDLPPIEGFKPGTTPQLHSAKQLLTVDDWKSEVLEAKQQEQRDQDSERNFPDLPSPSVGADGEPNYNAFVSEQKQAILDDLGLKPGEPLPDLKALKADQAKKEQHLTELFGTTRDVILGREAMDPEDIAQELRHANSYEEKQRSDGSVYGGREQRSHHERERDEKAERRAERRAHHHRHHHRHGHRDD